MERDRVAVVPSVARHAVHAGLVGGAGHVRRVDVLLPRLEATRLRHARDVCADVVPDPHGSHDTLGTTSLLYLAIGVFVVAWIGQFVGHKIEGRKPSFLTDLTYLLIGPAWVLAKLYRKLGWAY